MSEEPFDEAAYRAQQRKNANVTAIILIALVVLFFFITIAKLGLAT
jgi:biopolymer transport protein ExbD